MAKYIVKNIWEIFSKRKLIPSTSHKNIIISFEQAFYLLNIYIYCEYFKIRGSSMQLILATSYMLYEYFKNDYNFPEKMVYDCCINEEQFESKFFKKTTNNKLKDILINKSEKWDLSLTEFGERVVTSFENLEVVKEIQIDDTFKNHFEGSLVDNFHNFYRYKLINLSEYDIIELVKDIVRKNDK